jgi:hypothetical protein
MAGLSDSALLDLSKSTLDELGPPKFVQVAQKIQDYEAVERLLRKDRVQFDSGKAVSRRLMVTQSGNARHVGLYAKDTVIVGDVLAEINLPWKHTMAYYAWERREILMNRGKSKIVGLMDSRRADGMLGLIELMEEACWTKPDDSDDTDPPFGLPYWIVKNASTGFNGGNPAGFSSGPGGLVNDNFKNYTFQYAAMTKADAIKKMRTGYRKIGFKSPRNIPDYRRGRGNRYRLYVNEETISTMEEVGEAQNENLGRDLAPMDDTMAFKRNPIVWVPYLDVDTTNPIYMIDMSTFFPIFLSGDWLRETEPKFVYDSHNCLVVFIDLTWQLMCLNRRANAVGSL